MRECESFKWYYKSIKSQHLAHSSDVVYAPNEEGDINWKVANIAMWNTLTYGDIILQSANSYTLMLEIIVCQSIYINYTLV